MLAMLFMKVVIVIIKNCNKVHECHTLKADTLAC